LHELAVLLRGARHAGEPGAMEKQLAAGFPTGALAEFAIAGSWQQLDAGAGHLVRFLVPRDLRNGQLPETVA
jgi:phosphohistidine phosphatase